MADEQIKGLRKLHKFSKFWDQWKIVLDRETGLPKLPEGCFWNVERGLATGNLRVEICDTRAGISVGRTFYWDGSSTGQSLTSRVREVASFIVDEEIENTILKESLEDVVGQYPPKKLGE